MKSIHENKSGYVVINHKEVPGDSEVKTIYISDLVFFEYLHEAAYHGLATTTATHFYVGRVANGYLVDILSPGFNSVSDSISYIAKEIGVL